MTLARLECKYTFFQKSIAKNFVRKIKPSKSKKIIFHFSHLKRPF